MCLQVKIIGIFFGLDSLKLIELKILININTLTILQGVGA